MVKHTSAITARTTDKPSNRPDHASASQSLQSSRFSADEIILSLSNAYENKRARQVGEWERVQANRFQRAA